MNGSMTVDELLEAVAGVLIRCFFLGMAVMLFTFFVSLFGKELAYSVHSKMYDITAHEFELLLYFGLAFLKTMVFVLFLLPYIGIRMVLKKRG